MPQLLELLTVEKLLPLMDEAGVGRAVTVPPSWPGDRDDYDPHAFCGGAEQVTVR